MNLTGFRTIIVGLLMTIGVPALSYLTQVDWTALGVSPTVAFAISGVLMLAMRYVSSTPIAKQNAVPAVAAMSDAALHAAGVTKILTAPTQAGKELASLSPGSVVQELGNPSPRTGVGRRAS